MAKSKAKQDTGGLVGVAISTVGAMAAATIARRTVRIGWKAVTGEQPPTDPQSRETDWAVALLWAVASGATIGVVRMLVERQVVGRFVHHDPTA